MSNHPYKGTKQASGWCLCGNTATSKKGNYWVCDRCDRIEKMQRMDCKSHVSGMKQRRITDVLKAEVPV